MKRMPFEPPTQHYNPEIEAVDEQICHLIRQRKELSNNDPGFPTKDLIAEWSSKYGLYEEFLNSVFSTFLNEEMFKPVVEPEEFLKNIPVLKSFEKDGVFYTVAFVRQYNNASVVHFTIDKEGMDEDPRRYEDHSLYELSIEGDAVEYDCRNNFGGGSGTHYSYPFTVSPPLPDNLSNIKFNFKECKFPFQKPTGFEFVI
ncbi:hypothetical protein [Bacillus infantis]|uniref:hypothetical protein n=1 Tax=Bacillus infantis TaxID=324767 RepID=UPI003CED77B2